MSYRTYAIANIHSQHPFFDKVDEYSFECKNVFNSALYEYRQNFFHGEDLWSAFDMINHLKSLETKVPAKVKQQTIKQVYESMKSSIRNSKLPRYLDKNNGRANIILTNQAISRIKFDKENKISFNFKKETFEYDITNLKRKLQLQFSDIKQVRVVYKKSFKKYQVILIVNEKSKQKIKGRKVMAVDLGLDRIMSVVYGTKKVLFDGKQLKRVNHRFNRSLAKLQSERDLLKNQWIKLQCQLEKMDYDAIFYYELAIQFDFNEEKYKKLIRKQSHIINRLRKLEKIIARTYENRNNRLKYCLHWLSRRLIELCVSNGIGKIVIGYNKEWKQDINLGKRTNLNFVQIPHKTLIDYIQYKAAEYGIVVKLQEESYTSKCSFLDRELVKKHDIYAGKRIHRGLFRSKYGKQIHADINAAYNIAKKAGYNFFCLCPKSLCSWPVLKRIDFGSTKVS
jgi:putative transposase